MKNGLTMYINGKQLAQDKGGVGVQNMKDWTQHENFFIGRNVGGAGQVFANFYIASFVMFNSYLEAPAVYSVAKYYSRDGELFQHIASALGVGGGGWGGAGFCGAQSQSNHRDRLTDS